MNRSDHQVVIIVSMLLLLHVSVLIFGYWKNKLPAATFFLNLLIALLLIVYWGIREMKIGQHNIEGREIIVLVFELLAIAVAAYGIATGYRNNSLKILQYIVFGIHLSLLILGLIFMLTFKINKLI